MSHISEKGVGHQQTEGAAEAAGRILTLLSANKREEAAEMARRNVNRSHESPRLALNCLAALARVNDPAAAKPIVDRLLSGEQKISAESAILGAQLLLQQYRAKDALALCEKALAAGHSAPRLHLFVAHALIALDAPREDVVKHLETAQRAANEDIIVLSALGEALLSVGRYEEAAAALKKVVDRAPAARNIRFLYARALKFAKRYEEAADVIMADPGGLAKSTSWQRQATAALLQAGRETEAASLYAGLVAKRRTALAPTFAGHLRKLDVEPDEETIPRARFDWAWQVAGRLAGGPPSEDRAAWERRGRWGMKADLAILEWLECRPGAMGEITALIDKPSDAVRPIFDLLERGKGVLIASAHLGPMYAGPIVLQAGEVPFKVVASTPRISSATYAPHLISAVDQTEVQVIRQIIAALGKGFAVVITVDGAMNPTAPRVNWEHASITYSDFVAAMSFRLQIPSVFAVPYWADERIRFHVTELPFPQQEDSAEGFVGKWRGAFLDEMRGFFSRGPENMRFSGGIWRHISRSAGDDSFD